MKVSLVVLLGLIGAAALRRRSAAVRHWVLASAIVSAAMIPALETVVPSWQLPVHQWMTEKAAPLTLIASTPIARIDDSTDVTDPSGSRSISVARLLQWTWAAGSVCGLLLLFTGFARLGWLAARARVVERGRWVDAAAALSGVYGLRKPIRLLQSDHPTLLVTWGVRRPKVILPRDAHAWPDDRVRIVLGHELAHIDRGDWIVQIVGELLKSIYWFNPLVWIACRRLRHESEQACDDAVLGLGVEGTTYATHLLELAQAHRQQRAPMLPAPAMVRPSSLERRVSAMLNARLNHTPMKRLTAVMTVAAAASFAIWIAGIAASAQATSAGFSGQLLDAVGKMIPASALTLNHTGTGQKFEATSDQSGHFAFSALPAGDFTLEVGIPGFQRSQGKLTLAGGQNLVRDVALQVGELEETIKVVYVPNAPPPAPRTATPRTPNPQADRCGQSLIGGCIVAPVKIADWKPVYPPLQGANGVSAQVELQGRLGTDGFIKDLHVTAPSDQVFVDAAADAIRKWQFTTTRLDGVPVETPFKIHVTFALE